MLRSCLSILGHGVHDILTEGLGGVVVHGSDSVNEGSLLLVGEVSNFHALVGQLLDVLVVLGDLQISLSLYWSNQCYVLVACTELLRQIN